MAAYPGAGLRSDIRVGSMEAAPPDRPFDVYIFSDLCYSYIPERAVRRAPRLMATAAARLAASGRRPEATDVMSLELGGVHFAHQFLPGEIEAEAQAAGLHVIFHEIIDGGGTAALIRA